MVALTPRFALFAACALLVTPASAAPRRHLRMSAAGVSFDRASHGGAGTGRQALVSDGPGTGFGFHRLPAPLRTAAAAGRDRQAAAVRDTVVTDALTNGGSSNRGFSLPGDSVYGYGNAANYGVFSGSDGYGSPYFAGWYGPGGGADLGPLGHAYE